MIGTDEMLDLDTLPESQAASIAAFGGPVSQQLLDATAPIEDGEEYIRYLHERSPDSLSLGRSFLLYPFSGPLSRSTICLPQPAGHLHKFLGLPSLAFLPLPLFMLAPLPLLPLLLLSRLLYLCLILCLELGKVA